MCSIPIACWNVDGLFFRINGQRHCKLDDPLFGNTICKFDIIGLVETHCGMDDDLDLEGYYIYQNKRKKTHKHMKSSGGLAVLIKNHYRKHIKVLPVTNSEYIWIKLPKEPFGISEDLYICFTYICPKNSSYSNKRDDIFELIENDSAKYSSLGSCIVMGDFNGKTSTNADYIVNDLNLNMDIPCDLDILDSPIPRNNMDDRPVDNHGDKLLDLCKNAGYRIVNGRILGDTLGHFTCYNHVGSPSVIDYMLVNTSLLSSIKYFHVHTITPFSIHCMISAVLKIGKNITISRNSNSNCFNPPTYKWLPKYKDQYIHALQSAHCQESVKRFCNEQSGSSTNDINQAVSKITSIIVSAAKLAQIPKKNNTKSKKSRKRNKPWYDTDCKAAYKYLNYLGNRLKMYPYDKTLAQQLKQKRKEYKRLINYKAKLHKTGILTQFETLKSTNPTEFWKLFEKLKPPYKKHLESNSIPQNEWVMHFKSMMSSVSHQNAEFENYVNSYIAENKFSTFNELDYQITNTEIKRASLKLKNNKSSGTDGIPNEMIKFGCDYLLEAYKIVFNKILSNSEFPDLWRDNTLTPIHKKGDKLDPKNYRGIAVSNSLSKLFCTILNERLHKHCIKHNLIPPNQIGFKRGSRTADHILTLKTLIDKYIKRSEKYLFTCFVDFKSAFDTVWRNGIIFKLIKLGINGPFLKLIRNIKLGINGPFLKLIRNIYKNVKFRIKQIWML